MLRTDIFKAFKKLFIIYLAALGLSCGIWDLVLRPAIEPWSPPLGVGVLATGPLGKSKDTYLNTYSTPIKVVQDNTSPCPARCIILLILYHWKLKCGSWPTKLISWPADGQKQWLESKLGRTQVRNPDHEACGPQARYSYAGVTALKMVNGYFQDLDTSGRRDVAGGQAWGASSPAAHIWSSRAGHTNSIKTRTKDLSRLFYKEDTQMAKKRMKRMFNIISHQGNANQNHKAIPLHTH